MNPLTKLAALISYFAEKNAKERNSSRHTRKGKKKPPLDELLWRPKRAKSLRRLSYSLGITPSSTYDILKTLKMKPYVPDRRLKVCKIWKEKLEGNPKFAELFL